MKELDENNVASFNTARALGFGKILIKCKIKYVLLKLNLL